jgi:hypothetical protein
MSKRLEAMRANPAAGWTVSDIAALCAEFDVACHPPRGGGSHYRVGHRSQFEKLTIPAARPIKGWYIRERVRFIDKVGAAP